MDEHQDTGTGWPAGAQPTPSEPTPHEPASAEPTPVEPASAAGEAVEAPPREWDVDGPDDPPVPAPARRRLSVTGALIGVLLILFGFAFVAQLRSQATDPTLAADRPEDLVRILSDLDSRK